jgi:predicted nucleic acid-binding protein
LLYSAGAELRGIKPDFRIKRWLVSNKAAAKLRIFENLYQNTGIGVIDKEILEIAVSVYVKLRSKGTAVDDADILIAAFCIKHGLTLVTNNLKHFEAIEALSPANWLS